MSIIHEVKTIEPFFSDVCCGEKLFELRKNDRDYKVGDFLHHNQFVNGELTGLECYTEITYFLQGFAGLQEGYCILGIKLCAKEQIQHNAIKSEAE